MIRRPPRSTRVRSSAASDVYKRQAHVAPPLPKPLDLPLSGLLCGVICLAIFGTIPALTDEHMAKAFTALASQWCSEREETRGAPSGTSTINKNFIPVVFKLFHVTDPQIMS